VLRHKRCAAREGLASPKFSALLTIVGGLQNGRL
jgi:hypothetical protein